ncbi:MAG TPA: branched-chain amino acid ABC transporter permease [bacterium]|nr:branched-chain amino acid ABC transporter permease [bacterium]
MSGLLLQTIVSGLTLGSIYAIVALGFVVIYQATRVLNFAHGEVLMLGAMIGLVLHTQVGFPYWPTFFVVLIAVALVGLLVERTAYAPLASSPLSTVIMATAAVGQIIRSGVRIVQAEQLSFFPPMFSLEPIVIGPVVITRLNLGIAAIAVGLVAIFGLLFYATTLGTAMRGTSQNPTAAWLVGIDVHRILSLIWALSAALAAAAGLLIAPLVLVRPDMGVIAIKAFVGAVLGGFNSLPGAVVGSLLLGVIENLVGVFLTNAFKDVVVFGILIAVLLIRPSGVLGRPEARRV